jgi:hypothetical protein
MMFHLIEGAVDIRHALGDARLADVVMPMRASSWALRASLVLALFLMLF